MKSVFESYHSFFNSGEMENLISDLRTSGSEIDSILSVEVMSDAYRNAVNVIAAYIAEYGFNISVSNPICKGANAYDVIQQSQPFVRLTFSESDVMQIVDGLMEGNMFPCIVFHEDDSAYFDGEFHLSKECNVQLRAIIRDAVHVFIYGMPIINFNIIPQLKRQYILTGQIMQAVLYTSISTELCDNLCASAERYGITVMDWCAKFDNIWFDVSNQIPDGFVTVFHPQKPQKLTCISALYIGKYFITNMSVFQYLYEKDALHTVRFTNREVPVQSMNNGKPGDVINRIVEVPVYYDDEDELLVSDLVDDNYVYNELFICDVGRV